LIGSITAFGWGAYRSALERLAYFGLNSGVMQDGIVVPPYQGTPQGGPLSLLLANVMPDEVDK